MEALRKFGNRITRTKQIPKGDLETKLKRSLNVFDVTLIGVGHMCGAGIFVTTGEVMRNLAGPSTIISYMIAGLSALLSAICYAEFGSRYPKAGSAYTYAYVGCGEVWAFIIGWNVILEHVLSTAAVGRTFSGYVNHEAMGTIGTWTKEYVPWFDIPEMNMTEQGDYQICQNDTDSGALEDKSLIAVYPDFVSLAAVLLCAFFVGIGSKAAANFNSIFQIANLLVLFSVVGYGATFADFKNWENFAPCGVNGILAGASKCFFAYIGFEGLATTGEEAKDPSKTIPRATYLAMFITATTYILMAAVLSVMLPYYELQIDSVYSAAFISVGAPVWFSHVIAVGALLGILTSLLGSLFSLPRAVYAMADDGLLFEWWSHVNPWTRTPLNATITFTVLAGIISTAFDLDAIVDFLSVGTLMAYTMVSAALILLRYTPQPLADDPTAKDDGGQFRTRIPWLSRWMEGNSPRTVLFALLLMVACFAGIGIMMKTNFYREQTGMALMSALATVSLFCVVFIDGHHQNSMELDFKVCCVPYIPAFSLFINTIMLTQLTLMTWIRLVIWVSLGLSIYFCYGMRHSKENIRWNAEQAALNASSDISSVTMITETHSSGSSPLREATPSARQPESSSGAVDVEASQKSRKE